ncbi:hypothetical protein [Kocuria salsicia]|uniref:hypothetical protein n=1 Tax=Kocuria salsicia TaxID=664639 RepID=UPI0033E2FD1B
MHDKTRRAAQMKLRRHQRAQKVPGLKIVFSEIEFANGVLSIPFHEETRTDSLTFTLPQDWVLDTDLVALALTTLLGTKYSTVVFSDAISPETRGAVESVTQAEWVTGAARSPVSDSPPQRNDLALNFSGGFDSLAAQALLPRDAHLISLDFGGPFAREREFFKDFPTHTISTNFRESGFSLNTWSFMGVGSILLRDYLNLQTYSFGAILEASPWHFNAGMTSGNLRQAWFNQAGLTIFNPVIGLTEVGTAMIILSHRPELALRSLASVAGAGSLKHTRKLLLLHAAARHAPGPISLDPVNVEQPPLGVFGTNLANDFLSFYLYRVLGPEYTTLLVGDIPADVLNRIRPLSLDFYEKINTNFYSGVSPSLAAHALHEAAVSQCVPYTYTDWQEFLEVKNILAQFHEFPA